MKITFRGVIDTIVCLSVTTVLVYYNHVIDPSKWLWLDILGSAGVTWVMVNVFIKAYLYDQLKENAEK